MKPASITFAVVISLLVVAGIFQAVRGIATPPSAPVATTTPEVLPLPVEPSEVEPVAVASSTPLITVVSPLPNATVGSPLTVSGEARGYWYFEASFPISLLDATGAILATGIATAQGDWMTEEFVPFTATLTWASTTSATGTLKLMRDNPSGLPENDASLLIPVNF
jgi:hypothetical protein